MEFEKNTPATPQEVALASVPKLTMQPVSANVTPEPLLENRSYQSEASFAFETEQTVAPQPDQSATPSKSVHTTAAIVATCCVVLFSLAVAAILMLR